MLVTITSKGQLTLPKEIRDQLGLVVGSKLDFIIEADGPCACGHCAGVRRSVRLLHDRIAVSTVEQMNEAVGQYLGEDDERIRGSSGTPATRRKARR